MTAREPHAAGDEVVLGPWEREELAEACWLVDSGDPDWGWNNLTPENQAHHRAQVDHIAPAVERILAARLAAQAAEHVEKKWGPLVPTAYPAYFTTPPAAPETDVSALREAVERGLRKCRVEDAPVPLIGEYDLHHVTHMVAAELAPLLADLSSTRERLREVESERDAANVHAIECERIGVEAIEARIMATARAESAEAAHEALRDMLAPVLASHDAATADRVRRETTEGIAAAIEADVPAWLSQHFARIAREAGR